MEVQVGGAWEAEGGPGKEGELGAGTIPLGEPTCPTSTPSRHGRRKVVSRSSWFGTQRPLSCARCGRCSLRPRQGQRRAKVEESSGEITGVATKSGFPPVMKRQEKEKEKIQGAGVRFRVEWEDPRARDEIPERWAGGTAIVGFGRGRGFADLVSSRLLDSSQPPGWASAQNKRGTALSTLACVSRTAGDSMDLCNVWA